MKQRVFSQVWKGLTQTVTLASLTALTTIATINQPSYAQGTTFYCGKRWVSNKVRECPKD